MHLRECVVVSFIPVSCLNSGPLFRSFGLMGLIIFLQVHSRMKPKEPKIVFLSAPSQWSKSAKVPQPLPPSPESLSLSLPFSFLGAFLEAGAIQLT